MAARVRGYSSWAGEVAQGERGSLISMDTGVATGYTLESLQARGTLFLSPGERVYTGMIVGEHARPNDLACNPTKTKKLGNYRSETKDIDVGFKVPRRLSLDQALEWIAADELVEVTPGSIRMRNAILDARSASGAHSPLTHEPSALAFRVLARSCWSYQTPAFTKSPYRQGQDAASESENLTVRS